ncbi:hypothetical protein AYO40_01080 [Planctomycetaceae bacterium SCGC AG-212-D15]|nr:hypothetical protein AYO40_01080 [Planctomycetaceae bacterium SCGC AG-212-D15]
MFVLRITQTYNRNTSPLACGNINCRVFLEPPYSEYDVSKPGFDPIRTVLCQECAAHIANGKQFRLIVERDK